MPFLLLSIASPLAAAQSFPAEATAVGSPSESFAAGEAAFAAGDYATALARFAAARAAGTSGPAIDYNIAVCQYRLGRLDAAEQSFIALAEQFPAMAELARYNVGLIRLARGDTDGARAEFERTLGATDPALRDLATAALARIPRPVPPKPRLGGYVDIGAGHDSNVLLLEDSVLPAGQQSGSDFVELLGFASAVTGRAEAWRIDATGYAASYFDVTGFDQTAFAASGLRGLDRDAWHLDVGPTVGAGWLDGDGFERRLGAVLAVRRAVGAATTLRFRLEADDVDSLSGRFDYVAGTRRAAQVGVIRTLPQGRFSVDFSIESNDRAAASVSPARRRLGVGYSFAWRGAWAADLSAVLRDSDYHDLAIARDESLRELGVVARRALGRGWQLSAGARIADNGSTDPVFDYARTRITVGVNRTFQGGR